MGKTREPLQAQSLGVTSFSLVDKVTLRGQITSGPATQLGRITHFHLRYEDAAMLVASLAMRPDFDDILIGTAVALTKQREQEKYHRARIVPDDVIRADIIDARNTSNLRQRIALTITGRIKARGYVG